MAHSPAQALADVLRRLHAGERNAGTIAQLMAAAEPFARSGEDGPAVVAQALDRLESHIDNSPIAVAEWTVDGKILRWSEGARRMFGWSREELEANRHLPGWGMMHGEDMARVDSLMSQLIAGKLSRFTVINRNLTKWGAVIHCQWFNSALLDKHGKVISVFSHAVELGERLEAERQMREARDRLEFHVHNSPIAVTEWGPDFKWIRWSNGAERIFGYTEQEMIGASFVAQPFIHPDDLDELRERIDLLLDGRLPRFSAVNRNLRKDGTVIWCEWHNSAMLDARGKVISVLSQAVDVSDRIAAETGLRTTRERLEAHLDNSPIAIVEWGPDFRFLRWSRGAERIYGWTSEEMVGTRFDTMNPPMIHPESMDAAMKHVDLLLSGRAMSDSIIVRNLRKDGTPIWMNWHGSSLYDDKENLVSVLSQGIDITQRITAEHSLRDSESLFRAAFELTLVGMTQLDPVTRRYQHVNQQFCRLTGYSVDELRQMDPFQITHPDDLPRLHAQAEEMHAGRRDDYVDQRRIVRKDGATRWVHVAATVMRNAPGNPIRVISAAIDITDRVLAEQHLRESESQFRAAFDLAIVGMVEVDARTGRFIKVNRQYCELSGYSPEELYALTPADVTHPDDRAAELAKLQQMLSGESEDYISEKRCIRKDGSTMWIHVAATMICNADGKPDRAIGVIIDITQRKQAEHALRRAKEEAEAASRAKDRFIASLSHELRTPLTPARALLSVLRDDARLPADVRADLHLAHRNVQTESVLIDDLLDLTRLVRGDFQVHLEVCDANGLIDQAISNAAASLDEKVIEFRRDLRASRAIVTADPRRLMQVLANLLGNAVKFTPSGGSVTVASDDELPGRLRVTVTDTGIGINPLQLEHIFEPFERGEIEHRYEYSGLGLGLAIARSLLQRMDGTITATSEGSGRGASFAFTLPITSQQPAPRGDRTPPAASTGTGAVPMQLSILLIEDHTATADILARLLRRSGCTVRTVGTRHSAIDAAQSQPFDVIVSDIGLPDGSGHDLLRELRQQGLQTPAIALSGFGAVNDIAASKDAGFAEHLTKPVDFEHLRTEIERVVGEAR